MTNALFINSGILGQATFARFISSAFAGDSEGVHATQIVLTDALTLTDRAIRRLLCLSLWPDGWGGMKNLDFRRFRAELNAGLLARRRIRRLERSGARFDVLHFHRQGTAYASLGRIRRTPTIISLDSTQRAVLQSARTALEGRTYGPNVRRDGQIFRAAKLVIATSRWAATCLRDEYPDCRTEIAVMPNPVQLDHFDPVWGEQRYARAVHTAGYQPRVLFLGGDFRRKGGYDLLDAWRRGQLGQRAHLDLVTNWPVESEGLPPGVNLHQNVVAHSPEWRTLWREADLFVLPTRDEAFGLVFQEAAAAGLPAIGTGINAVPEIIDDGQSGLLVPPGDSEALIRALDQLIASADLRRRMGAHGRAFIVQSADPDAYRRKLGAAIRNLARK
jgi:glycosyltransferase involved in cell wall biosynthesis